MTSRFVGSGRAVEGTKAKLAVHKQDFVAHHTGGDFKHNADHIQMNPPLDITSGTNVQQTLEQLADIITSAGSGFISIGQVDDDDPPDGYALGSYNVGSVGTPTLYDAINAALIDDRIRNGGIIFILAGTYKLGPATAVIPPGITLMGEIGSTVIVGEMLEVPMFKFLKSLENFSLGGDSGTGPIAIQQGGPFDHSGLMNLILADNLNGRITSGGEPVASMQTAPMVQMEIGASLHVENVRFLGRINNGSVSGRLKTLRAIGTTGSSGPATHLTVENCLFDGLQTGLRFTPGNDAIDYLNVRNCRARTFGTEDLGDVTEINNCFAAFSLCNATFTNNYHVGAGSSVATVRSFAVISSSGGGTDARIVLTGNSGAGNSASNAMDLLTDTTGSSIATVRSGNNWGTNINNEWYVTVGNSNPTSSTPPGDFIGSRSIDTLLNLYGVSDIGPTTVIVNPGTYQITTAIAANKLNFIGNKRDSTYPVFSFDLQNSSVDIVGNPTFLVGSYIKSIKFKCYTSTTSRYHSVTPSGEDAHGTTIEDCLFTNVGLVIGRISTGTQDSDTNRTRITLKDCHFLQDGDFADNISLLLPTANSTLVENCTFRFNGYVGGIGEISGLTYTHNATVPQALFRNCTFDQTDGSTTITASSPAGSEFNNWFWVDDTTLSITFQNCQFLCKDDLTAVTDRISSGLTSAGTFDKFIRMKAKSINFYDCLINGPVQTFTAGGQTYAMPALYVEPQESFRFINSRIIGGGLPLQISGSTAFSSANTRDSLVIQNSDFSAASGSTLSTQTLVSIDVDLDSFVSTHRSPLMVIDNNNFYQKVGSSMTQVRHTENTGAYYTAQGVVQIYAPYFDIKYTNNRLQGVLRQYGTFAAPYRHYAGVVIDNFDATTTSDGGGEVIRRVTAHGNTIITQNNFENADADSSAACLWIRSSVMQVYDNYLGMQNSANTGGMNTFAGCLYIDNRESLDAVYSDSIVTGNIFSRRGDGDGAANSLRRAFVVITSASGRGALVENSFSDATINGSATTLVEDNSSSTNQWRVERNKNQTGAIEVRGNEGILSLALNSSSSKTVVGAVTSMPASNVRHLYNSSTANIVYGYGDTSTDGTMVWSVPLYGLVPEGAYIVSVSVAVDVSANPSTTSVATLTLRDINGSTTDTSNPLTTSGDTLTISPAANVWRSIPSLATTIELSMRISGSSTLEFSAAPLMITYRW